MSGPGIDQAVFGEMLYIVSHGGSVERPLLISENSKNLPMLRQNGVIVVKQEELLKMREDYIKEEAKRECTSER